LIEVQVAGQAFYNDHTPGLYYVLVNYGHLALDDEKNEKLYGITVKSAQENYFSLIKTIL